MAITDKTRKILWAKSGNLCAMCRKQLVIEKTSLDSESVVGEECHIISTAQTGPRNDSTYPKEKIDDISNLILLCRIHHKMIDDQSETYTISILQNIKNNHEKWVENKLNEQELNKEVKIRRIKSEIPDKLILINSGKELFNLASSVCGMYMDYSNDLIEYEWELIGNFFQNVQDWVDVALFPLDFIQASKSIDDDIKKLKANNFFVFAAIENQRLEGGLHAPSVFKMLHLSVMRENDSRILKI